MNIGAIRAKLVNKSNWIKSCNGYNLYRIKSEYITELEDSEFYFESNSKINHLILKV